MRGIKKLQEVRRRKLRELYEDIGKSELARRMGISPDFLYQMAKGKDQSARTINDGYARLAEKAGRKDDGWLDLDDDAPPIVRDQNASYDIRPELVYVEAIKDATLSAGSGDVVVEHERVEESHAFRSDYMHRRHLNAKKCTVWKVRGDSMVPRYNDGDVVLIDTSDTMPRHGKVYALTGEEGMRVKQLRKDANGAWHMYSFNPDQWTYPPEPLTDDMRILGRVRWHAGDDD